MVPGAKQDAEGGESSSRWGGRSRRLAEVAVAAVVGVLLAGAGVVAGVYEPLICAGFAVGCPPHGVRGEIPVPRALSGGEVATGGSYVGLGDSYSSGEGVYDEEIEKVPLNEGAARCRRSRESYVLAVAKAYRFGDVRFWACGGATTGSFLKGQGGQPPQLDRVTSSVSLVTLTLGGNDAGFSTVLTECFVKVSWSSGCVDQEPEVRRRITGLARTLYDVLAGIRSRAPHARIIVVGYPRPFPRNPADDVAVLGPVPAFSVSVEDQRWINRMTRALDDEIGRVANGLDRMIAAFRGQGSVEYIDGYDAFEGHEVGTADPFVHGVLLEPGLPPVNRNSFHPTHGGYRRLADLVKQRIAAGPGRPMYNYRIERH
ncbi:SGNH/GDSL hydrolase family protein [Thermopolyspora sp. NPDC052614]|uniref:SGNH/GDSL hydrolase family protein n=1 Tax=Thermopolyspora sp. NPDC052614 TaxID=3155682 RepID=UPI003420B940